MMTLKYSTVNKQVVLLETSLRLNYYKRTNLRTTSLILSYPKNISDVRKGKAKKVQVTERLKGVKSL